MGTIRLNDLVGDELAKKLASAGLHRITGITDIRSAIETLGKNIYTKNAEYKNIAQGLAALANLTL